MPAANPLKIALQGWNEGRHEYTGLWRYVQERIAQIERRPAQAVTVRAQEAAADVIEAKTGRRPAGAPPPGPGSPTYVPPPPTETTPAGQANDLAIALDGYNRGHTDYADLSAFTRARIAEIEHVPAGTVRARAQKAAAEVIGSKEGEPTVEEEAEAPDYSAALEPNRAWGRLVHSLSRNHANASVTLLTVARRLPHL